MRIVLATRQVERLWYLGKYFDQALVKTKQNRSKQANQRGDKIGGGMVCGRDVSPGDSHLEDFLFFPQSPPVVQKGPFPLGEGLLMCQEIDVPRSSP